MLDANHRGDLDASFDALQRIYHEAIGAGGTLSARPAEEERLRSPLGLLSAHVLPHAPHIGEHARACLLDHAAELQQATTDLTGEQVLVDVAAGALERAGEAWGPATPGAQSG